MYCVIVRLEQLWIGLWLVNLTDVSTTWKEGIFIPSYSYGKSILGGGFVYSFSFLSFYLSRLWSVSSPLRLMKHFNRVILNRSTTLQGSKHLPQVTSWTSQKKKSLLSWPSLCESSYTKYSRHFQRKFASMIDSQTWKRHYEYRNLVQAPSSHSIISGYCY